LDWRRIFIINSVFYDAVLTRINGMNNEQFVPSTNRYKAGTKKCNACTRFKPLSEFNLSSRSDARFGLRANCKQCDSIRYRNYTEANKRRTVVEQPSTKKCTGCKVEKPVSMFTKSMATRDHLDYKCRTCKQRENKASGKRRDNRSRFLRIKYGLTRDQYEEIMKAQDGRCAICGFIFDRSLGHGMNGHVDHNHETGKVRSLLCNRCNGRLAAVEDVDFREKAIAYLSRHAGFE
jgi:hypothetical protein